MMCLLLANSRLSYLDVALTEENGDQPVSLQPPAASEGPPGPPPNVTQLTRCCCLSTFVGVHASVAMDSQPQRECNHEVLDDLEDYFHRLDARRSEMEAGLINASAEEDLDVELHVKLWRCIET